MKKKSEKRSMINQGASDSTSVPSSPFIHTAPAKAPAATSTIVEPTARPSLFLENASASMRSSAPSVRTIRGERAKVSDMTFSGGLGRLGGAQGAKGASLAAIAAGASGLRANSLVGPT